MDTASSHGLRKNGVCHSSAPGGTCRSMMLTAIGGFAWFGMGANEAVKYRGRKARLLEGMLFDIHTLVTSAKE